MAKDYAKSRKRTGRRPATRRSQTQARPPRRPLQFFLAGVVTGIFASFIIYLQFLPAGSGGGVGQELAGDATPTPQTETPAPEPRFDFYTMLPAQTIEVDADEEAAEPPPAARAPGPDPGARPTARSQKFYLLQAGSFRQREDADRRRAELLLLGLDPTVEEIRGNDGRWHRVKLGPFASRTEAKRVRGLTAAQDIETLLLQRSGP